ncbi:AAA family ATPase [Helicobacter pylori]|nr:AAA family ATPase [Helicobacter pylori]RVY15241.1 AAA family ATPase [Helicobacter pylori]RVY19490.1 AAA family ATPase [Helicobacter pylori]RVY93518.1 AAA family ATPase [Helicobacter pylori]
MYLNNSFNGDKLGGLVIILGENNTGKSNLLKALGCFSEHVNEFKKNCTPNYVGYEESISFLKLSTLKDKILQNEMTLTIDSSSKITFDESIAKVDLLEGVCYKALNNDLLSEEDKLSYEKAIEKCRSLYPHRNDLIKEKERILLDLYNRYNKTISCIPNNIQNELPSQVISNMRDLCETLWEENVQNFRSDFCDNLKTKFRSAWLEKMIQDLTAKTTLEDKNEILKNFKEKLLPIAQEWLKNDYYMSELKLSQITILHFINDDDFLKIESDEPTNELEQVSNNQLAIYTSVDDLLNSEPIDVSKISRFSQVIYYDNKKRFKHKDLIVKPEELEKSVFFRAFFKAIGVNLSSVKKSYSKASGNIGYLTQLQDEIKEKVISKITNRFNRLYFQKDQNRKWSYLFDFRLDLHNISLSLFKKDSNKQKEVLHLDDQSDGFKWFFNLFFGLLFGNSLKKDAIVLMDEMGSNLSVPTRKECRKFLKEFGQRVGVTFVLVIHDLFLVDMNHLNELRVLRHNEESLQSVGIRHFSSVDLGDNGALKTIKKSLGVSHKILNENDRLLFVEGISYYNYLSAFKLLYEQEKKTSLDMAFLPVNGLGNDDLKESKKPQMKQILETLAEEKPNATLLVDGDTRGKACEELNKELKNKLNILKLNDCDDSFKNFKNIEDCFSQKDKIKLDLKNKSSRSHTAYTNALKNDLLLNPSLVEAERKFLQAFGMALS